MRHRFPPAETWIFLGIWLSLMLFGRSALLRDPGTYWHTAVGRQMLRSGAVVRADQFSFTRGGEPWVVHQWLAECGMAAIHRAAGFDGLLLATATLLAGVFTWIASRLLRAGFHVAAAGLVLALLLSASSHQFHVRPLILTMALFTLTFSWLVDVEAGRKPPGRLWWFVPVTILWANLHAGVLAGMGTLGACVAGWCLAWLLAGGATEPTTTPIRRGRHAVGLLCLVLVCGAGVLLNPYGLDLPRAWLRTLSLPLPGLIQEHGPLDPSEPFAWAALVLAGGYVVSLLGLPRASVRVSWLVPLVWFALGCGRVRNLPLFAIAAAIVLAEVLPATRWAAWLRRREMLSAQPESGSATRREPRWRAGLLPLLAVAAVGLLQGAGVSAPVVGRGWAEFDARRFPTELVPRLKEILASEPEDPRIFNDLNFGGFLIYHAPGLRVFIDDRCALYGSELLEAYDHARRNQPAEIDRWQRRYGFRYALVETGKPSDRHLGQSARWALIGRTPCAALYACRAAASRTE